MELKEIIKGGKEKLHILADFDGTLTKSYVNGKEVPSAISILRNSDYISKDYAEKAHALANHYMPIEKNPDVSIKEKRKMMEKWWTKHFNLLIKSGLNKKHLESIIYDERLQFREGVSEFLDILHKNKIPLVIMSSSGLGEIIPMLLKRERKFYSNVHIIANSFRWSKKGYALKIKKPIIHSMNKDETMVKNYPFYGKIKNRKNVILLGNSLGDIEMITGFDYDNLLKIGFLKDKTKNYDIILKENDSFGYINQLIKETI